MSSLLLYLFTLLFLFSSSQATVRKSKTFNFLIDGLFGGLLADYEVYFADLDISNSPFALCVYGLQPKVDFGETNMTLAIRLDTRLVWQANRNLPVHNNSTLSFRSDGNLVLAQADNTVVWQTNTANKGVVDIKLLSDGNLVLLDKRGGFVWQSFDYPTDTILVGQSLLAGERHKLVSRVSASDSSYGSYSLVIEGQKSLFYYKSKHSRERERYGLFVDSAGTISKITFESNHATYDPAFYELMLTTTDIDSSISGTIFYGAQVKFNTTYSFFQLGHDGNLRYYTYTDNVNDKLSRNAWDVTFTLFSRVQYAESECQLPERCGKFGVCENNQCVACPTPKGPMGWSDKCAPPKLAPCKGGSRSNVGYYKITGIDHFSGNYSGDAPVKLDECRNRCSNNCKCQGFFYKKVTSTCLLTTQLNTLTKVSNSSYLGFIKVAS